tara:strand:- start:100 stop:279 length:180 start_codon:yes stop_codon:yes gene_type:complete
MPNGNLKGSAGGIKNNPRLGSKPRKREVYKTRSTKLSDRKESRIQEAGGWQAYKKKYKS